VLIPPNGIHSAPSREQCEAVGFLLARRWRPNPPPEAHPIFQGSSMCGVVGHLAPGDPATRQHARTRPRTYRFMRILQGVHSVPAGQRDGCRRLRQRWAAPHGSNNAGDIDGQGSTAPTGQVGAVSGIARRRNKADQRKQLGDNVGGKGLSWRHNANATIRDCLLDRIRQCDFADQLSSSIYPDPDNVTTALGDVLGLQRSDRPPTPGNVSTCAKAVPAPMRSGFVHELRSNAARHIPDADQTTRRLPVKDIVSDDARRVVRSPRTSGSSGQQRRQRRMARKAGPARSRFTHLETSPRPGVPTASGSSGRDCSTLITRATHSQGCGGRIIGFGG